MKGLVTVSMLTMMLMSPIVISKNAPNLPQKEQIEKIVHDYLILNPEVLVEASQVLQQKQQNEMLAKTKVTIQENASALFNGTLTTLGNPKGKVTLVEFFDYQCSHCKKMSTIISTLINKNHDLRVIYKELPIFGHSSETASKAALAAAIQGKYQALHDILIAQKDRLNDAIIYKSAKQVGLNMSKFKQDMHGKLIATELEETSKLAERLRLMGTPAFIVAATPDGIFKTTSQPFFIPGAASIDTLQSMITKTATA